MKSVQSYFVLCFFAWPLLLFSQVEISSASPSNDFEVHEAELSIKSFMLNSRGINNLNNQIFIHQVGAENKVVTHIHSEKAVINLNQKGFNNGIQLNIAAEEVNENITQHGSFNQVYDHVNNAFKDVSLNLEQHGENLLFERYGANSIGNKLQFKMTGQDNSLIIRNFK